ncbi:hypothetical protein CD127_12400 [Staphylococcus petrasii]|uniref:hypothetical protein n=1 Tax=Staphylococcus petrasii TaxID=1276936 RepID=UPI000CD28776|nr:hypothetical protein [Staphylococcus petrasii]PNZ79523.1 hypothetical protein CD127_12400 [Staphylococcus petrasii]
MIFKPFSDESKYIVGDWETNTDEYITFHKNGNLDTEDTDGSNLEYGNYQIKRYGKPKEYKLTVNIENEPEATFNLRFSDDYKTIYLTSDDNVSIVLNREN